MNSILGIAWENILIGLLSGGVVGLYGLIKKRIVDWRIEKKFPIAGNYLTKFEDEKEGKKFSQAASATLLQKGRKVSGETKMLNENRIWIIDGQVTDGGYFHGIYYSKDPHDKGIGNFFLYINYQKYMEGLWSGYDSVNKKIVSGIYTFRPIMTEILIAKISENDIGAIANIADCELGNDYLSEELLSDYASAKDKYLFQVARDGKEIIGFSLSIISDKEEVKRYIKADKLNKMFEFSKKIGIVKTVAVKDSHKGRGIGTELIRHSLDELEELHSIRSFCSIGWKNNDKINIEGILKRFGFVYLKEIPEYWSKDSIEKDYHCVICGSPPCKCGAVIYTKSI